ncbi:MAG: dihydroorotase family protein [Treponema sp.]|jgi:dihydroorotase|nr:dihydroorotase family protein [Treponema sp.]
MHYDLLIKNGTLVTPKESLQGGIAVKDGKIILAGNSAINDTDTAGEIYDARGKHILPGIIDAHVHFRDPGLTEKEDFETGSIAAAFGGITLAADMPNTLPVTSTAELFKEKIKLAKEKSCIDFALFALLANDNSSQVEDLTRAGAFGFKVFLGTSTGGIAAPSASVLARQAKICESLGMRVGFHAETGDLNAYYTSIFKTVENLSESRLLSEARPVFSEVLAIQTAICFARYTGTKIHIHHVTSKDGAAIIAEAKRKGVNVTAETCPHYLLFDTGQDLAHKVYPPIRSAEDRKALWDAVKTGTIDMLASDHAPHTVNEKQLPLWEAPAGLCGTETFVTLMLNEVNKGEISINEFVRLASEAPAKIWNVYPQKGNLLPGADADFTIVDMKNKSKINVNNMRSKSKTSPYDGFDIQGTVCATIVRGKFVLKDGIYTGAKGYGVLISPVL